MTAGRGTLRPTDAELETLAEVNKRANRLAGDGPHAGIVAAIVKDGVVLCFGENDVNLAHDATRHAEIVAIGRAGAAIGSPDPSAVTDTLTLTDALFLPRMRIMEYIHVTTADDARAAARAMRTLFESRSETICLEGRRMFEMGVTLRNSFEDRDGNLFQRVYLMPEDCRRFY